MCFVKTYCNLKSYTQTLEFICLYNQHVRFGVFNYLNNAIMPGYVNKTCCFHLHHVLR